MTFYSSKAINLILFKFLLTYIKFVIAPNSAKAKIKYAKV